ncbi:zinc finger protein 488 [Pelodiscus sinensis]|uniref:zinc finger protein 488 n=1 Tax=Pelodiscus sinensis TaxID=13735 RepID=UPI003F6AC70B
MELPALPKLLWTGDNKLLHQHFPEVFATVQTTQDIPEQASFGPCMLQNTLLDTLAFIALKCSERRTIHYVFKVDVTAAPSPAVLPWMRLVQPAASGKEQNLEAYLKHSQLYYRPTRKIGKTEELLVWYDEELSSLLGFSALKARTLPADLRCPACGQAFKGQHCYLAHVHFLCALEKHAPPGSNLPEQKARKDHSAAQATNFHSLARDLEGKPALRRDEPHGLPGERRAKSDEAESPRSRKTVLLEKTNNLGEAPSHGGKEEAAGELAAAGSVWKLSSGKLAAKKEAGEHKPSAFTEVRRLKDRLRGERAKELEPGGDLGLWGKEQMPKGMGLISSGSAFSFVWPARARGEQKSAFSKPTKCLAGRALGTSSHPTTESPKSPLGELSGFITTAAITCYGSLVDSKFLVRGLCNSQALQASLSRGDAVPCPSDPWPKQPGGQLQTPAPSSSSSSLPLLPPTFTSFGVAAQNWCAKCNLSFRMTSDLVFHMRSHHKKDYASPESQCKRRREEKLTCPICHEYFRERHHLSRHMTSHN